jgi:hypothetical protein
MGTHLSSLNFWCIHYEKLQICTYCAVCVCLNVATQKPQMDFHEAWYWGSFKSISQHIPVVIKVKQQQWAFYMKMYICISMQLAKYLSEWKLFHTDFVEKM